MKKRGEWEGKKKWILGNYCKHKTTRDRPKQKDHGGGQGEKKIRYLCTHILQEGDNPWEDQTKETIGRTKEKEILYVVHYPRYNMKCSGENVILRGIFHVVRVYDFPQHFMLNRGNLDCFSNSDNSELVKRRNLWGGPTGNTEQNKCVEVA